MSNAQAITVQQSGAFVESFVIEPTADGPLAGLQFAVKDLIDIAGHKTGCGNPTWRETHSPPRSHAVCVEQLLAAGARFIGKTVTDELAFSLIGENHFYGTPLNPRAPDRVPGGSSSGSASAVACGLADLALGTDTGGSVRVPASNCGIWGLRPSHGFISVAGVMPFAPSFDSVGLFARDAQVLARAAGVLLAGPQPAAAQPRAIHLVRDAFALAEPAVQQVHEHSIQQLRTQFGNAVRETSLREIVGTDEDANFDRWLEAFCYLQWAEIESSLGGWIAAVQPEFGPVTTANFELVKCFDRRRIGAVVEFREQCFCKLREFLGPRDLLCIPTAPAPAPIKGSLGKEQRSGNYYRSALSLTSIAGLGRLPQVSMPLATVSGDGSTAPIGLSLLGSFGEDLFLLDVVQSIAAARVNL